MRVGSRVVLLEPAQVQTCNVGSRPVPGGGGPPAGGPVLDQRRPRPARWFPARLRAGARLSPEKAGRKSAGGNAPWTPFFMARSFPLARFGGCGALFRSLGYFATHLRALIWRLSFAKMLSSIFFLENASQIGLRIPLAIAPQPYQNQQSQKPASGNERP